MLLDHGLEAGHRLHDDDSLHPARQGTQNRVPDEGPAQAAAHEADRVGLMGSGLGGALVWNSVLGPLAGRVKAVVVMQAVASLEAVIQEHKFKAPCLRAYGLPADTPDEEAIARVAPHDPLRRLRKLQPGTPLPRTAIYHGAEDANIPPETSAIPLAEALRRAGGEVSLELFPGVGHAVYAMGEPIERRIEAFFSFLREDRMSL
ncbi:hypothetical protein DRO42_04330 [Candidatus Bathyarchaeota archaeon]|nr:MAG: hypothetical protein DRO42_04330 [Candidatus Bathyarchaeota archaeon]